MTRSFTALAVLSLYEPRTLISRTVSQERAKEKQQSEAHRFVSNANALTVHSMLMMGRMLRLGVPDFCHG
jgi:hypothetical protein